MTRIVKLTLAVLLIVALVFPTSAFAQEQPSIDPQMIIDLNTVSISIDSYGVASCDAFATSDLDHTIRAVGKLQRWNGSSWVTIKTWTNTDTISVMLSEQYCVSSGYTYRFFVLFYLYDSDGTLLEVVSNSNSQYY